MVYFISGLIAGILIGIFVPKKKPEKHMSSLTAMVASKTVKRAFYE